MDQILLLLASPFIGSFLGVVAIRLPSRQSFVKGRSACPMCGHILQPWDLVPLLSWLALQGGCRYCAAPIGIFYPGMELAAVGIVVSSVTVLSGPLLWASCLFGWVLLVLGAMDLRERILVDTLTLPLIPAGLVAVFLYDRDALWEHAIGALIGFAGFWGVAKVYRLLRSRDGLGLGDAKLLAGIGSWVSWVGLPGVVLMAAVLALTAVMVSRLLGRPVDRLEEIPFGPFLCLGAWITWLHGPLTLG